MKKLLMILLILCIATLHASSSNIKTINDDDVRDMLVFNIVNKSVITYDDDELVEWYLAAYYGDMYRSIYRDEFKIDEVKSKKLPELKKKLADVKPVSTEQKYSFKMPGYTRLKKYDFSKKGFPIEGAVENGTYVYFGTNGSDKGIDRNSGIRLKFDNADESKNFIAIDKLKAKKLKKDIDKNGKTINVDYIYTINSFDAKKGFDIKNTSMTIIIHVDLISVEYSYVNRKQKRIVFGKHNFSPTVKDVKETKKLKISTVSPDGYTVDGYSSGMTLQEYTKRYYIKRKESGLGNYLMMNDTFDTDKDRTKDKTKIYHSAIINKDVDAMVLLSFTGMAPNKLYSTYITWDFSGIGDENTKNIFFKKLTKALTSKYGVFSRKIEGKVEWKNSKTISITLDSNYGDTVSILYTDLVVEKEKNDYKKVLNKIDNSEKNVMDASLLL